jgi:hypothetical protein
MLVNKLGSEVGAASQVLPNSQARNLRETFARCAFYFAQCLNYDQLRKTDVLCFYGEFEIILLSPRPSKNLYNRQLGLRAFISAVRHLQVPLSSASDT